MSSRTATRPWGALTPEYVASLMNFSKSSPEWTYQLDRTMESRQAEGVAHIWNLLGTKRLALLADEVGMGKTFQALGVLCLLWKMKPDAKILILTPNKDICRHWTSEYRSFVKGHYRDIDHLVRSAHGGDPIKDFIFCTNHADLSAKVKRGTGNAFLATIHMLSGMVRDLPETERLNAAANQGNILRKSLLKALGNQPFDLLIVDEAHYFRRSDGNSQRAKAAAKLFSPNESPLARRTLLLTATPSHSGLHDIANVLSTFHDLEPDAASHPERLLEDYALRRLRQMRGKEEQLFNKHNYRQEVALATDFTTDPNAELFFAQYQRHLVRSTQKRQNEGRRFLYGYLEGFESVPSDDLQRARSKSQDATNSELENGSDSYVEAVDTKVLSKLSKQYHEVIGRFPQHPKYDGLIRHVVPKTLDSTLRPHNYKHLIFVRRIPSVREITQRVNQDYDQLFASMIISAWGIDLKDKIAIRWQERRWSREEFMTFTRIARSRAALSDAGDDQENQSLSSTEEEEADAGPDGILGSRIANLFVTEKGKTVVGSTDCSKVRLRFRKPESLFSLFMEPAANYREEGYTTYLPASQTKSADFSTCARNSRLSRLGDISRDTEYDHQDNRTPEKYQSRQPLQTAWGLMYPHLSSQEKAIIDQWSKNCSILENFADYIQSGFLFASPVMIELYCWYTRFCRTEKQTTKGVQHRYEAFLRYVKNEIPKSLMLQYFKEALLTFEDFCEKIAGRRLEDYKSGWRVFSNLQNPAWYASGETTNRQFLITGFNSPFFPKVLTATAVFQEGVNLHMQCRQVHHYGIAWTPGDNEQRVGRVDRLFGLVNRELGENDNATLDIHYPFLSGTFDEDQVASFIMRKLRVEGQLDKCLQSKFNTEIDLGFSDGDWQRYLRTPVPVNQEVEDPYPAKHIVVNSATKPYVPYKLGIGKELFDRIRLKLSVALQQYPIHIAVPKEDPFKNLILIDPVLPIECGQRKQPVIAELCFSSQLSSVASPVAYYVSFRSPLSTSARLTEVGLTKVIRAYSEIQNEYPLARLAINHQQPKSWFFLQVKADIPVLVHHKHFDMLSSHEIKMAFEQVKALTDLLERKVFAEFSQDISKERLNELSISTIVSPASIGGSRSKRSNLPPLQKPWRRMQPFHLNVAYLSKKYTYEAFLEHFIDGYDWSYITKGRRRSKQSQEETLLTLNNRYPFLLFKNLPDGSVSVSLPFPVEDFQNEERDLLEKWFGLVIGVNS